MAAFSKQEAVFCVYIYIYIFLNEISAVSQVSRICSDMYFRRSGFVLDTSLENEFTAVHRSSGSPTRKYTTIRFTDQTDTCLYMLTICFCHLFM